MKDLGRHENVKYVEWAWHLLLIQYDCQLDSSGAKAVGGLWIEWQLLPRSSGKNNGSPASLWYTILPRLQDSKCAL